jgi:phosphate transport system permease protein
MTKPEIKTIDKVNRTLGKRHRAEKRFRLYGILSIGFGLLCVLFLFTNIIGKGLSGFTYHYLNLAVEMDAETLEISDTSNLNQILAGNYSGVVKRSTYEYFDVKSRRDKRDARKLLSIDGTGYLLQDRFKENAEDIINTSSTVWALVDDKVDYYLKHIGEPGEPGKHEFNEKQLQWIHAAVESGDLQKRFNWAFFNNGDSAHSEEAGIRGAVMGSFYLLLVTLALSFPIGIATAIYLEEYAPKNKWTDIIEVNINNLAAVPSIIFGLLGLAMVLPLFEYLSGGHLRSTPLIGGFVLTLMTLPTIIISSRASIKAVPPSIREAAYGLGSSKMQVTLHHVLPLAMPGMLTGTIIGLAQALGESAPLLMIGMAAFIPEVPAGVTDSATVLPMQIFQWFRNADAGFSEKASAAILVLLMFLIVMNALAVWARRRLERRW